jgi:hypothetical protein
MRASILALLLAVPLGAQTPEPRVDAFAPVRYLVAVVPGGAAFTSEPATGPRFRLTYLRKAEDLATVRFEIAPPATSEAFKTYLEAATRKVK